jgi:hypothetical protein
MSYTPEQILAILDACCHNCTFPMLDNGYVYLAASRLSVFHSATDWALAIEIFGYSPRGGSPDVSVYTFASCLHQRNTNYVTPEAYENYLAQNPHNELQFFEPLGDDHSWQDEENAWELISRTATHFPLREQLFPLPERNAYAQQGIELAQPEDIQVYELCRFLAETQRERVLATPEERRVSVLPELTQVLLLEEWRHPDLVEEELPSTTLAFQQLAQVLATGDPTHYTASEPPNTHWSHWPEGGTL